MQEEAREQEGGATSPALHLACARLKMSFLAPPKAAQSSATAAPPPPDSSALPVELESVTNASAEEKSGLRGMMSSYLDSSELGRLCTTILN